MDRAQPAYADLEIRILERRPEGYPVELSLDTGQEFPRGHLSFDILPWQPSSQPDLDGERLFAWFASDGAIRQAWTAARHACPRCRVRLRIDDRAPELQALPWELLAEHTAASPALCLAASDATPFSRYLTGTWQPGNAVLQRPLRLLAAIAAPQDLADLGLPSLDANAELEVLRQAAQGLELEITPFPVDQNQPCTLSALEAELRKGYHILHVIAHGMLDERTGQAYLVLADENNTAVPVAGTAVAGVLARHMSGGAAAPANQLRLVYLDACLSAAQTPGGAHSGSGLRSVLRGLAPSLVQAGVPAVMAMQTEVRVDTSKVLRSTFYASLLQQGCVDVAANAARSAVLTTGLPDYGAPVLYMRLRQGRLLGTRGRVLGDQGDNFWSTLLANIADGECTPFLGSGVTHGLLPSADELAQVLSEEFHYPFASTDLPRVAQFVGVTDNRRLRRRLQQRMVEGFKRRMGLKQEPQDGQAALSAVAANAKWAAASRQSIEGELHGILAELNLPLYITTNSDNFLQLALEQRLGKPVRSVAVDWRKPLQLDAARPHFDFDPPASAGDPVVLQLFGSDADLLSLVVTEDDYLDYLARIARDFEYLLPTSVHAALASTTLLFLGYRLEDLDLKVILRGLLPKLDLERWGMLHVAVQVEDTPEDPARQREMVQYLERYFSRSKIDVYWGSTQQFVADLHARWQEYRTAAVRAA